MGFVIKGKSSIFLVDEVTEGTYVAPTNENQAIEVLEDFSGFEYTRESIERSVLSNTVESELPRAGLPNVAGTLPTEFKAAATAGAAPRADKAYRSLLGGKRQATAMAVVVGSTSTVINLSDVDVAKVAIGDSLLFKIAGAYSVRPIVAVDDTPGSSNVTLAFALSSAPTAATVISALTTYYHESAEYSFSVAAEMGQEITEQAAGIKVESGEIGNWTTGQIPTINFGLKALTLDKVDSVTGLEPDFSAEPQPPVALCAKAYIDGVSVEYNEFGLNINNTIVDLLSASKCGGKLASRLTNLLVSGSINPYMDSDNVTRFDKFNNSTPVSIFIYISNPKVTDGEFENVAAIWLPKVVFTSVTNGDEEGVLTDQLEFQAGKSLGNDTVFISFM